MTKLREWQTSHHDLFIKNLDNQSSPDSTHNVLDKLTPMEYLERYNQTTEK